MKSAWLRVKRGSKKNVASDGFSLKSSWLPFNKASIKSGPNSLKTAHVKKLAFKNASKRTPALAWLFLKGSWFNYCTGKSSWKKTRPEESFISWFNYYTGQGKVINIMFFIASLFFIACHQNIEDNSPLEVNFKHYSNTYWTFDTVWFVNQSTGLFDFTWSFGDDEDTGSIHAYHVYYHPGEYKVTLTGFLDNKLVDSLSSSVAIIQPTDLYLRVFLSDSITTVDSCYVFIFGNRSDWLDNKNHIESSVTDENGYALFRDLQPVQYYVTAFRDSAGEDFFHNYSTGYITHQLDSMQLNYYKIFLTSN